VIKQAETALESCADIESRSEAPLYVVATYTGLMIEAVGGLLWKVEWANQHNRTTWKNVTLTTLQIKELVDLGRHV